MPIEATLCGSAAMVLGTSSNLTMTIEAYMRASVDGCVNVHASDSEGHDSDRDADAGVGAKAASVWLRTLYR